jgi:hypothetical protein
MFPFFSLWRINVCVDYKNMANLGVVVKTGMGHHFCFFSPLVLKEPSK